MKILKKSMVRKIFKENGCWMAKGTEEVIDEIVYGILVDTSIRSKKVLEAWNRKKLTTAAFEIAYDQHQQSKIADIAEMMINTLKDVLDRRGESIARQYRKGTQVNLKAAKQKAA